MLKIKVNTCLLGQAFGQTVLACFGILRLHDNITFDSQVHFKPNLGQINFVISLIKGKRNEIKRMLELKMAWLPSGGHDKVFAYFGNLALSNIQDLKD